MAVTAGLGASVGNLTFGVDRLATAGSVRSGNIFTSGGTAVAADAAILLATGGQSLGFSTLASDNALAIGAHTDHRHAGLGRRDEDRRHRARSSTLIDGTNDTLS